MAQRKQLSLFDWCVAAVKRTNTASGNSLKYSKRRKRAIPDSSKSCRPRFMWIFSCFTASVEVRAHTVPGLLCHPGAFYTHADKILGRELVCEAFFQCIQCIHEFTVI